MERWSWKCTQWSLTMWYSRRVTTGETNFGANAVKECRMREVSDMIGQSMDNLAPAESCSSFEVRLVILVVSFEIVNCCLALALARVALVWASMSKVVCLVTAATARLYMNWPIISDTSLILRSSTALAPKLVSPVAILLISLTSAKASRKYFFASVQPWSRRVFFVYLLYALLIIPLDAACFCSALTSSSLPIVKKASSRISWIFSSWLK